MRAVGALAAAVVVVAGTVAIAAPADATTRGIRKPTLTVVCAQPHHGDSYTAVRFRQHGRWTPRGAVVVTLTPATSVHTKSEMHTRTGASGWFRLRRTLHSINTGPWVAGHTYSWTTELSGRDWATARRGTVTLTGSC
jgi:hypothetical protein